MRKTYPYPASEAIVSIGLGILLSLVTCGIYLLFWEYRQMKTLNAWLGREEFDFLVWILLSLITCGIFAVYYEYKMARAINTIQGRAGEHVNDTLPLISLVLAIFGLPLVSTAIQQAEINELYGDNPDI